MKLQALPPAQLPTGNLLKKAPEQPPAPPGDGFEPSGPPPTSTWKKIANAAVGAVSGGTVATVLATVLIAANANGPDALGAPILGAMIGGPVGLVAGAVAGWKNCGGENPSVARKLANAVAWGVVGAGVGAVGSVALAASGMQGPDALAALLFAPAGAAVGAAAAGVVGWKMTQG